MAINLNNFVNVAIKYHKTSKVSSTRDTAVLIAGGETDSDITYTSLDSFAEKYPIGKKLYYYGYTFFSNGGLKLRVIQKATKATQKTNYILTSNTDFSSFAGTTYYINDYGVKATPKNLKLYKASPVTTSTSGVTFYNLNSVETAPSFFSVSTPASEGYYQADPITDQSYTGDRYYYDDTLTNPCYRKLTGNVNQNVTYYKITLSTATQYADYRNPEIYCEEKVIDIPSGNDNVQETVYAPINRTSKFTITFTSPTIDTEWSGYYCEYNRNVPTPLSEGLYIAETETDYEDITMTNFKDIVNTLGTDYIVIASDLDYKYVNNVALEVNSEANLKDSVINEKIFISCLEASKDEDVDLDVIAEGMALKYGDKGIEMTIAAYLTKVNVDYYNSIQDYNFTSENVVQFFTNSQGISDEYGHYYDDDALYKRMNEQNVNIDCMLENAVRNLGGNDLKGYSLINTYVLILLNQTLTERLVGLLVNKIKYNQTGLTMIGSTIAKELERYVNNGFLSTDKSWTEDDLVYNGTTIISKNVPLKKGYKYVILPFSTLSDEDLRQHKLPTIYVLVADQYSIRKINVIGEVF